LSMGIVGRASLAFTCLIAGAFAALASSKDTIKDPLTGKKGARDQATAARPAPPAAEKRVHLVELWRVPLGSPLSGPLLLQDELVAASVEGGNTQAFSLTEGRPLWKADLGEKPVGGPVSLGRLIVQATLSGKVQALESAGGERRWTADLGQEIGKQPTATADGLLVPLASGTIVSLDPEGHERWKAELRGAPSVPLSACRGMAVAGTEAGTVEAFQRDSGRRLWVARIGSPVRSPLLCFRDRIYFATEDERIRVLSYSGRKKWSYPVGGAVTALPFAVGLRVYFLSYDNYIYALKATSGNLLLRVRMSHRLSDDASVGTERVYLSPYTSARLTALTLPELQLVGEYSLDLVGEWFTTPPLQAAGRVVVGYGRYEGRILALKEEREAPEKAAPRPGGP
jgi:outer membrane protein assembly factor BamB